MGTNEFDKGTIFNYEQSIDYADKAVVSKHVLKRSTGNITLFSRWHSISEKVL